MFERSLQLLRNIIPKIYFLFGFRQNASSPISSVAATLDDIFDRHRSKFLLQRLLPPVMQVMLPKFFTGLKFKSFEGVGCSSRVKTTFSR